MNKYLANRLIYKYFESWVDQDLAVFLSTLSTDVSIIECYGPMYLGIQEAREWFVDWHNRPEKGQVTRWEILNILYDDLLQLAAIEWEFECFYDGQPAGFPGVSLIYFDDTQIKRIQEYKMEPNHYRPYAVSDHQVDGDLP